MGGVSIRMVRSKKRLKENYGSSVYRYIVHLRINRRGYIIIIIYIKSLNVFYFFSFFFFESTRPQYLFIVRGMIPNKIQINVMK